jgi:hypothetical protein
VIDRYKEVGIDIGEFNGFKRDFTIRLRRLFSPIKKGEKPIDNDLVLMVNIDGSYHIGIIEDGMISHNFKPSGNGSVIRSSILRARAYFNRVEVYRANNIHTNS